MNQNAVCTVNTYPGMGHMLVVSAEWQSVYWLPRRKAAVNRQGGVELTGSTETMYEAQGELRRNGLRLIDFTEVRTHTVADLSGRSAAARAARVLLDPAMIAEVLYPPYEAEHPFGRYPYLRPPEGLLWAASLLLDPATRTARWLDLSPEFDDSLMYEAPAPGWGQIRWGDARLCTDQDGASAAILVEAASAKR